MMTLSNVFEGIFNQDISKSDTKTQFLTVAGWLFVHSAELNSPFRSTRDERIVSTILTKTIFDLPVDEQNYILIKVQKNYRIRIYKSYIRVDISSEKRNIKLVSIIMLRENEKIPEYIKLGDGFAVCIEKGRLLNPH